MVFKNVAAEDVVTAVIVGEGVVRRQYEQTASRDHDVTLVPGTYPVVAHKSPEGWLTHYSASIPAVAHAHVASTAEFGGVAYGWEQRGGETEIYGFQMYGYQIKSGSDLGGLRFI